MRIHYRKVDDGIEIIRCFGADAEIVVPEKIDALPVVSAAAYAFSAHKMKEDEDVSVYEDEDAELFGGEEELLAGENVESVFFPDSMKRIGRYIFYGCRNLRHFGFADRLKDIGSGAFTGCRALGELSVRLLDGEKSCVPEILGDLWQRIDVEFLYPRLKERARLVFPEHYEEAVENTPARILFTQHHGSGNNYRQCFYNRELDYRKYDELFAVAKVYDRTEVLSDLIFSRLLSPIGLTESARSAYEAYVRGNIVPVAEYLTDTGNMDALREISARGLWSREGLEYAVEHAVLTQKREVLCELMDEKHRLFPDRKKKYDL